MSERPIPVADLRCPAPTVLPDTAAETRLGAVFFPYLRDYVGADDRPGPRGPICPFVRHALSVGALHYGELDLDPGTTSEQLARALLRYLAWFDTLPQRPDEHHGLVLALPGHADDVLVTLAEAYNAVRVAVYERGCTSAIFFADPTDVDGEPSYFTAPAPFYVLRRIVAADFPMALRVPEMFPAFHRLFAEEVRRSRLRTDQARKDWHHACRRQALNP